MYLILKSNRCWSIIIDIATLVSEAGKLDFDELKIAPDDLHGLESKVIKKDVDKLGTGPIVLKKIIDIFRSGVVIKKRRNK